VSLSLTLAHSAHERVCFVSAVYYDGRPVRTLWHQRSHWSHCVHRMPLPLGRLQNGRSQTASLTLSYGRLCSRSRALI